MELKTGITLSKGFWVIIPHRRKEVYIEISDNGYIDIWNYKSGVHYYTIVNREFYVMMFQLASVLNN